VPAPILVNEFPAVVLVRAPEYVLLLPLAPTLSATAPRARLWLPFSPPKVALVKPARNVTDPP
jgi:hypothetical protein